MIVLLDDDGTIRLEAADDFRRFHCEIGLAHASLEAAQAALAGTARIESREHAWVDLAALLRLGRQAAPEPEAWAAAAQAMVDKARPHGWVRDEPTAIKAHIEWKV
jgi:hypothetical protein